MSTNFPWEVDDTEPSGGQRMPWEEDDSASVAAPLRGAEIKPQPSLLSRLASEAKGFAAELPLIGMRGFDLVRDLGQGKKPWDPVVARERSERERKINELLGAAEPGDEERRLGRKVARMVPQAAAAYMTGGMSLPAQGAIQGGVQALQSLSEGASPEAALTGAAIAGLAPGVGSKILNPAFSKIKAPFAKAVDRTAMEAFERLGIKPPASAISRSPVVQQAEALASKFPGGQELTERSLAAQEAIPLAAQRTVLRAGDPDAIAAGTNIAQDVFDADAQAAARESMLSAERQAFEQAQRAARQQTAESLYDPRLADDASQVLAGGLQSRRLAFEEAKNALWNKVDLSDIAVNPEQTLTRIERLLERGDLPPGDLASLRTLRESLAPRRMLDLGGGNMIPEGEISSTFTSAMGPDPRLRLVPKSGSEILSQLRGLRERVPYGQGQGVFASPALRKGLAGDLRRELGDVVSKTNPEMGSNFAAANRFYERGVEPFKSDWAKRIFKLTKSGNVSKIADEVIKPGTAPEEIAAIMQQTGSADAIRANVMQRILSRAKGDPTKIAKALEDWKNLGSILTRDQMDQLKTLASPLQEFTPPTGPVAGPTTSGQLLGGGRLGTPVRGAFTSGNPSKVVELVVRPNSTPQEIAAAMKAAGPAAPEIQANALRRILGVGSEAKQRLTPEEVFRRVDAWGGPEKLRTFLEPDQVQAVMDVIRASRAMGKAGRITGGSQTAFLGNMVALAVQFPRAPLSTLRTLATAVPVSTLMSKKAGQQWLTTGFGKATLPGKAVKAGAVPLARMPSEAQMEQRRRIDALLASE